MSEKNSDRVNSAANILINIFYCTLLLACIGSIVYLGRRVYVQTIKSGSGDKNSEARLEKFEKDAVKYYEDKYGDELKIKDSGFICVEGMSQTKTKDMYIETENGTGIIYIEETKRIYDNQQSEDIEKELKDTVLKEVLHETALLYGKKSEKDIVMEKAVFNYYGEGKNIKGNYYHEFYDGDIEEYVKKEDIRVNDADIYILCDRNFDMTGFMKDLEIKARDKFTDFEQSDITVCFLGEECYNRYVERTYRKPDIDMDDCYARYVTGRKQDAYIQNYIQVARGIYVTSAEKNLILSEGDIELKEVMEGTEINNIMEENYSKHIQSSKEEEQTQKNSEISDSGFYLMIAETPVYQFRFSDKINHYIEGKTYKELKVYMKLVPEEIGAEGTLKERIDNGMLPQDNEAINASLAKQAEAYEAEKEELIKKIREGNAEEQKINLNKSDLWQQCALYYLPYRYEEASYDAQCLDIYSDMSDGEMAALNTDNYYVAGYRVKVK